MRHLLLASLAVIASLVACSSDSDGGTAAGGGCSTAAQCATGLCLRSADFPDGYCSKGCEPGNPSSCPSGSTCIDDASGAPADAGVRAVCYQTCAAKADCQNGLDCLEKSSKKVCRSGA